MIGINSQIETGGGSGSGSVGIPFAVPIDTAKEFLPRLARGGQATLAYLGVGPIGNGSRRGVLVRVEPGGPAANGGLKDRDTIESIDGCSVATMDQVQAVVAARNPGQVVPIRVRRGSSAESLRVVLGNRPARGLK